jgi:hypothetical protein
MPDANKGSDIVGSAMKDKPGVIPNQISGVPSVDGHFR